MELADGYSLIAAGVRERELETSPGRRGGVLLRRAARERARLTAARVLEEEFIGEGRKR